MWSSLGAHAQPTLRAVIECGFFSGSAGRQVRREVAEARTPATGETARAEILDAVPTADVTVEQLDLADLGSVHAFADRLTAQTQTLELLLNNAGVMAVPTRMLTVDGFELQFATNYLGPFALTNRLLPLLLATPNARPARTTGSKRRSDGSSTRPDRTNVLSRLLTDVEAPVTGDELAARARKGRRPRVTATGVGPKAILAPRHVSHCR